MINPKRYRANKGDRINSIYLKISIARKGRPATPEEIRDALEYASRHGEAPPGFRIRAVNWQHPNSSGDGDIGDLEAFRALVRHLKDDIQVSPVKRTR